MLEYLDSNSIVAEIIMSQPSKETCWLLVEGETDSRVFESFKSKQSNCNIRFTNGKPALNKISQELKEKQINNFIVIVDADFAHLGINDFLEDTNIFYTDYHDIEMMILNSAALTKLLNTYADSLEITKLLNKFNKETILEFILDKSSSLGLFLLKSIQNNWNYSFEDINYSKYYNTEYKIESFVEDILNKSSDFSSNVSKNHIIEMLKDENSYKIDLLQLCRGHDANHILALLIANKIKKDKYVATHFVKKKKSLIDDMLRLAYSYDDFKESKLYKSIVKWEADNAPFKIFAR